MTATQLPCEARAPGAELSDAVVLRDRDCLRVLGAGLDQLNRSTAAPVTARRPWLQAWLDAHDSYEPLVVGLRRGDRLVAVAPLAYRHRKTWTHVVVMGHGTSDETRLPSVDDAAADALAAAVHEAVSSLRRRVRLEVRHVCPQDAAVAAIAAAFARSAVDPGDISPRLRLGTKRAFRAYVTRNHHQQHRRLVNRIARSGLDLGVTHVREPDDAARLLPEMQALCRERDIQLRGASRMDDPAFAEFFSTLVVRHATLDEVELTILRLDGTLAAYVLCFRDGAARRMWHTRVHPRWQSYGAGRLATDAAVEAALADGSCQLFDWMRGDEPYKFSLADHVYRTVDLQASSDPATWCAIALRRHARRMKNDHASLGRLWDRLQPYLEAAGRR